MSWGPFCLFSPQAGRSREARGCTCVSACVQQDTCAFVCGVKGKAPSFSIGKSLLLVVLSLLLLPEATGWSQLAWWAPITPHSHQPDPLSASGYSRRAEGGMCQARGKAKGKAGNSGLRPWPWPQKPPGQ